jgi:hypothetical protein
MEVEDYYLGGWNIIGFDVRLILGMLCTTHSYHYLIANNYSLVLENFYWSFNKFC